jgi:hypothetical protein
MTSTFSSSRDIQVGNAQLGTYTNFTTISGDISLVPGAGVSGLTKYSDVYNIEPTTSITVTLPSPSNVMIGWRCKINANLRQTTTTRGSIATLTINDHLGNTVYVFFTLMYINGTSTPNRFSYPSAVFTLRDATTWIVEPDLPEKGKVGYVTTFNNISPLVGLGYPMLRQASSIGRGIVFANDTNINVLYPGSAVPVTFRKDLFSYCFDPSFYSVSGSPFNAITFIVTGNYSFEFPMTIDGSAVTGCQFHVLLNGVTIIPSMVASVTGSVVELAQYIIKSQYRFTAGDSIQIMAGKLVVAGTATVSTSSLLSFNYLGN